jgi:hypothetical protein
MLARRVTTALLFLLAAVLLQRSAQLSWGGADAPDGTRYKVGPLVVVHVLAPHQTISPTIPCAVDPRSTDPAPCALVAGGERAAHLIHVAWHTLPIMVALAVLAALIALAPAAIGRWSVIPAITSIAATLLVVVVMWTQPPLALEALHGLDYGLGGNFAMMEVGLALLLLPTAAVTVTRPLDTKRGALELGILCALACVALLGFRFFDWPPVLIAEPIVALLAYSALARRLRIPPGS